MESDNKGIFIIGGIIVLFLAYQQNFLQLSQLILIILAAAGLWLYIKRGDLAELLKKQAIPYKFPNAHKEYEKIKELYLDSPHTSIILGKLHGFHGDSEFGTNANQPTMIQYIAEYVDLDDPSHSVYFCKLSQSVLDVDKDGYGLMSQIPKFTPMENLHYSISGAKKYPTDKGEKFYTARARPVISIDAESEPVDSGSDETPLPEEQENLK